MEQQRRGRLGLVIFLSFFLMFAGAIGATVLLANDRRNLNRLLRSLGFEVTETMVIPKPGTLEKFKGKRLQGATLMLDSWIFMPEIRNGQSTFLRNMHKDGETLCAMFDRLGFPMSTWQPGSFAKSVNECYNQVNLLNPADPDNPSSFFLMVKGRPDGTLISTRVKFIFHDADSRRRLIEMTAKVMTYFAEATKWTEILDEKPKLLSLTPFSTTEFGIASRFSSEFSSEGRYNLIFAKAPAILPAQKRTDAFFDREKYLPLTPDYGGPPLAEEAAKT